MKKLMKHIQNVFAAVAFAEAGEHDVAMDVAGIKPDRRDWAKILANFVEKRLLAVTFAEANCHEIALEYVGGQRCHTKTTSFTSFLENVGLNNVRVCYVMARV